MISSRMSRLVGVFALLNSALAAAQEPLDVERYAAMVKRANPAARAAEGFGLAAGAEVLSSRLIPDPVFEYSWDRATPTGAGSPGTEMAYTGSQTLPWPGTYAANRRAGDRAAEGLRARAEESVWDLEIAARSAFARLEAARALVEVARSAEAAAGSLRDLTARRAELGEARETDRIKAAIEWLRQQRDFAAAEREAESTEAIFRALAVEALPRPLVLAQTERPRLEPLDTGELLARLGDQSAVLRRARAESGRQEALLSAARQSRFPDLALSGFRQLEIDKAATGFSLGVKLPLWNANRGEIARADAAVKVARAQAEGTRIALEAELETRIRELRVAADQWTLLDEEILPRAAESVGLARFSYQEGETTLLDLLDAERTYRDAQREQVLAQRSLFLSAAEVQLLVGPGFQPWRQTP